jgi:predicted transcriptional regulator of viral defense system
VNKLIENSLQKYPLVDYATIKNLLSENGYKYINDKIKYMKQQGLLTSLKKELYIYNSPYVKTLISKEIIANNLLGPSYISYEYALSYYGLTPERVEEVTSATTKRSKTFSTAYGTFSYRHIDKKLYALGVKIVSSKQGNFMMASKEKALCDKVFATKGVKISSKKSMRIFLEEDLRIDMDELFDFDLETVQQYAEVSKSKRVEFLYKVLKDMAK